MGVLEMPSRRLVKFFATAYTTRANHWTVAWPNMIKLRVKLSRHQAWAMQNIAGEQGYAIFSLPLHGCCVAGDLYVIILG